MGKNGKEKGQELNGKKMELNGGKWERQWRICEFALFEINENIWVCPGTLRVTRQSPTSSLGQNHASTPLRENREKPKKIEGFAYIAGPSFFAPVRFIGQLFLYHDFAVVGWKMANTMLERLNTEKYHAIMVKIDLEDSMERRIQIYTADSQAFLSAGAHGFIAEFADERIARHYVDYLFRKNQGKHKAIIVKEYILSKMPEAKVTAVLAETGEAFLVDEYIFTD